MKEGAEGENEMQPAVVGPTEASGETEGREGWSSSTPSASGDEAHQDPPQAGGDGDGGGGSGASLGGGEGPRAHRQGHQ